jgi:hypothetical protein
VEPQSRKQADDAFRNPLLSFSARFISFTFCIPFSDKASAYLHKC